MTVAAYPHTKKADQQEILDSAKSLGVIGTVRRKPWQVVDDPTIAIDIIGLDCLVQGKGWLDKHPQEKQFLASQGVSEEEAIALHKKWSKEMFKKFGRDETGKIIAVESS